MQSDTDIVRKAGRAEGRVQGVGFRVFVRTLAKAFGVTSRVKNMRGDLQVVEGENKFAIRY